MANRLTALILRVDLAKQKPISLNAAEHMIKHSTKASGIVLPRSGHATNTF